ncbi:MAG: glycosyltransferase [Pseudomonadales bacterium GWC1_66_9]|nr:MAG: glycosyltransferase [Pseudomonadales bacterium GWC1_66_9]
MILTSLLLTLGTTAMAGQVYTWVDKQGVTHFSEQPPSDQASSTLSTAAPPPRLPAAEKLPPPPSSDPDQEGIERKVKRDIAIQEAKRREYCETIRTNLAQLENNPRLRAQINGEMRRLTEEERQARIAEAKRAIEGSCR